MRLAIADEQVALHTAQLAAYDGQPSRGRAPASSAGTRTIEQWRGVTLRMGKLYERAAIEFWTDVAKDAEVLSGASVRPRAARRSGPRPRRP